MATFVTKLTHDQYIYFLFEKKGKLETHRAIGDFETFMKNLGFRFRFSVTRRDVLLEVYEDGRSYILVESKRIRPFRIYNQKIYAVEIELHHYDPKSHLISGLEGLVRNILEEVSLEGELRKGEEYFT
ncbi:MAG: hypothetical protein J7L59_01505 [Nanoarchaeota archaeon]|nr:hypothetical protein [Nanoarchaeota archaeon]